MFANYQLFLNQPGYSVEYCTTEQKQQRVTTVSTANEPIGCAVEQIHSGANRALSKGPLPGLLQKQQQFLLKLY